MSNYSQWWALRSIIKASFRAILKSPQTLFFSILFPLVFVFIFGSFQGGELSRVKLAIAPGSDTLNEFYGRLKALRGIELINSSDTAFITRRLEDGDIAASLLLKKPDSPATHPYAISLRYTNATQPQVEHILPLLEAVSYKLSQATPAASIDARSGRYEIRPFRNIDFVLPGMIGFSILFATLFGISFVFYQLREQGVLKRFYATPVNRLHILLGIGSSRIAYQLLSIIILIVIGRLAWDFTLLHGWVTVVNMLLLSILLLVLLMGVGLLIASLARTDTVIPLYINIFALPQMLLAGTFFSISVFPEWLQTICKVFPLTHFNDAMRKIAFHGASLSACLPQIGVMLLWTVAVYFLVFKIFRWE